MDDRKEFLVRMYDQLFSDINRHILVVWQSVSVLVGAFAIFALTEKQIITLDVATALIVLLTAWLIAHLYDASYWYNRNLVIIANIERQFLVMEDLKKIHYYFGRHRPKNRMISHLKIQYALAVGLMALVMLFHFVARVVPGLTSPWQCIDLQRALPYVFAFGAGVYLAILSRQKVKAYEEFIANSPGDPVDTTGVLYGVGHGFRKGDGDGG